VRFHERIRLGRPEGGELISEDALIALLEECEAANGGENITFFEITTAAALLAFARNPADYLLLEVGLGGRLDATNVIAKPVATVITQIDLDHQHYLGDTITLIAQEKAGILKKGVPCIVAPQTDEARNEIENVAEDIRAPLHIGNQDWQAYEQHGRLVFQDEDGLLDLPMPQLPGRHQIDNAGSAIATLRVIGDSRVNEAHIAAGLKQANWPARMQRLGPGLLWQFTHQHAELWLDGGHNPAAGRALARAFADLNEKVSRPLVLIWGMLNTKEAGGFIAPFAGLAQRVFTLTIPDEENALPATVLADTARRHGISAETAPSLNEALRLAGEVSPPPRVLICGSLYLAGRVLAEHNGEAMSQVTGAGRR
jgi:dihydrofolate synthase/folylpolyglutamate synthase